MTEKSLLGLDFSLTGAESPQERIIKACAKCWFEKNKSGRHNWGDCSGFVKAVQKELDLRPFQGDANSIFEEIEDRPDWWILGSGAHGLTAAGDAANAGALTIGVWRYHPTPSGGQVGWSRIPGHGHVAIITAYVPMLGSTPEQHAVSAWGQLGHVGRTMERLSASFGKDKHRAIRYAKCLSCISY